MAKASAAAKETVSMDDNRRKALDAALGQIEPQVRR